MKKIGILYICTWRYVVFWEDFYKSSETYFCKDEECEIYYFVFTDSKKIKFESNKRVHKIYQEHFKWPFPTLHRFKTFNKSKNRYKDMDYLYFFNANMLFVDYVGKEIFPDKNKSYSFCQHPGFYGKERSQFPYEEDKKSLAFVSKEEGKIYFMGSLNGGIRTEYLKVCEILEKKIDLDYKNKIIAIWHDESHLNRFAIDNEERIKVLNPSFAFIDEANLPFKAKIRIRDKYKYPGFKSYLKRRNYKNLFDYIKKFPFGIIRKIILLYKLLVKHLR